MLDFLWDCLATSMKCIIGLGFALIILAFADTYILTPIGKRIWEEQANRKN